MRKPPLSRRLDSIELHQVRVILQNIATDATVNDQAPRLCERQIERMAVKLEKQAAALRHWGGPLSTDKSLAIDTVTHYTCHYNTRSDRLPFTKYHKAEVAHTRCSSVRSCDAITLSRADAVALIAKWNRAPGHIRYSL